MRLQRAADPRQLPGPVRHAHPARAFRATSLDGLSFFLTVHFPGALHEGNGTNQPIIDERATQEQRDALVAIVSGKHSDEGTLFHILS